MKHLKRYNESTYNQVDMVNDLKDMLYDMIDLGFYTRVSEEKGLITVCISRSFLTLRNIKGFIRSEEELNALKELLTRVNEYGKSCEHLVDRTWLARVNNLSDGLMSGQSMMKTQLNYDSFNKLMNDNRCTMYITMYPKNSRNVF